MIFCAAIALAVSAASCGGGDGPSGDSSLSKAEYIDKANALCNRERRNIIAEFSAYERKHRGEGTKEEVFARMMQDVLLPKMENNIATLRRLEPPPGDRARIEAFIRAQQKAIAEMSKLKRLPTSGPASEKYLVPSTRLAKAYGIVRCAQT